MRQPSVLDCAEDRTEEHPARIRVDVYLSLRGIEGPAVGRNVQVDPAFFG
jgi:hypothetical protein